ncbi:MAG: SDR family NAD(P)-dependent oxidoreductase [Clostridiales bacterium]|nr:SDR family NAD(P)-dependent oxidoreductase [Clostridiales bacterium]
MKKIAIITGASSGMGKRFVETLDEYGSFDEVWAVARRREALENLSCPYPVKPVALDLSKPEATDEFARLLESEKPRVGLLINAAGYGKFDAVMDVPLGDNLGMVDLNCRALIALTQLTVPYMEKGGLVINIASMAAFQPIPYIAVYGATKAFVLSYSRALRRELKDADVMAVCPYWTKTAFFDRAVSENNVVKKYAVMYKPEDIVAQAWKDAKKRKEVSVYGFTARGQRLLVKLLPHRLVMNVWMRQQKLKAK